MKSRLYLSLAALVFFLRATSLVAQTPAVEPAEGFIVTPDNVRIFYKVVGSGSETLVAVHGGPGNSRESIRADLEPLARGRRVIYYDQRGNGRSELIKDGGKLGYQHHVADLDAVRQHFKLERMTLLGNSWGRLLISLYAVAYPSARRKVFRFPLSQLVLEFHRGLSPTIHSYEETCFDLFRHSVFDTRGPGRRAGRIVGGLHPDARQGADLL
ncbi:MAG TPA: alpha/beta fold hydrolase [Pyrinomonadaceae bacterium]|nr:alpha/beta fold hydrolase [Pyrinomonadaceae bacterium]